MKSRIQLAVAVLLTCLLVPLASLSVGCAGSGAQRVTYVATETIGGAANMAHDAMAEYMRVKAVEAIGSESTIEQKFAWIQARPEWQQTRQLHKKFFDAYEAWVRANAAAASGEKLTELDFRLVVEAAEELFYVVGQYVPAVGEWSVVGERVVTK